jgi:Rrf2 family nitric oxide-sensitive transcriptional repressor
MQLTRFTDYALRVLLYVGKQDGLQCTVGEIATYFRISPEHLRKVIHKMAKEGYLETRRGRRGGFVLAREPDRMRIGDVVLAMEKDFSIVDCHALECRFAPGCSLKAALDRGGRAFIDALNEVTLADLIADRAMRQQFQRIRLHRVAARS